jgi:hypothetical protein
MESLMLKSRRQLAGQSHIKSSKAEVQNGAAEGILDPFD